MPSAKNRNLTLIYFLLQVIYYIVLIKTIKIHFSNFTVCKSRSDESDPKCPFFTLEVKHSFMQLFIVFLQEMSCVKNRFLFFSIGISITTRNLLAWPWRTLSTASRMSYGVTSVRLLSPLSTVTFVTCIYVKPV